MAAEVLYLARAGFVCCLSGQLTFVSSPTTRSCCCCCFPRRLSIVSDTTSRVLVVRTYPIRPATDATQKLYISRRQSVLFDSSSHVIILHAPLHHTPYTLRLAICSKVIGIKYWDIVLLIGDEAVASKFLPFRSYSSC